MQHPRQQQLKQPVLWRRLVVGCIVTLLLLLAGLTLFLSIGQIIGGIWSYLLPIVFTITAILVPFWQALFPLSANQPASSHQEEYDTNTSDYPGKYNIKNDSPVQGQIIGDHANVTIHFGSSQEGEGFPPESSNHKSDHLPNIFYYNVPHLPNIDEFYGRGRERITLLGRARKGLSTSIVGPRRIGKTWLIDYLELAAPTQLQFATLDGTMPQCQTITEFCARVLNAFGVPLAASQANMDMLGRFVREQKARMITSVLCIDEFEGFFNKQAFDFEFLANLRYLAQNDGLALVIGSKTSLIDLVSEHYKTSPFFNIFDQLSLKPFEKAEAEEFAQKKSAQAGWNDEERTALLTYGQERKNQQRWLPLRLQLVGQMLLEDKHLAATGTPDYYRPGDAAYWSEFERRLEERYRGVVPK
jgi:hypothetical protein